MAEGLDLPPRFAVKTGMLASLGNGAQLLRFCERHGHPPLVVDPLWRASSGGSMWPGTDEAEVARWLLAVLLPNATAVTPNWPELAWLRGIDPLADRQAAERALRALPCAAVLKGGHGPAPWQGVDLVWDGTEVHELAADRPFARTVRGTGCRFATALAVGLLRGETLLSAARSAKALVADHAVQTTYGL